LCLSQVQAGPARPQRKIATQKYLEKRPGEINVDSGFQVQLYWRKMMAAANEKAGWRLVVCGLCYTGSDNAQA